VLIRAAYVAPLLGFLSRRSASLARMRDRVKGMQDRMSSSPDGAEDAYAEVNRRRKPASGRDLQRFTSRVTQSLADMEYFLRAPLGWREGTAVVWAGMRGAVTVAAAQTLPDDTPQRPVLILIAFAVAVLSLVVQGGTIGPLLKRIAPQKDAAEVSTQAEEERARLFELMRASGEAVEKETPVEERSAEGFEAAKRYQLAVIAAQRTALLDARDHGTFDADLLEKGLANLDTSQIALEMRASMTD
jgi:monovalent cation/hydrogen antiporter